MTTELRKEKAIRTWKDGDQLTGTRDRKDRAEQGLLVGITNLGELSFCVFQGTGLQGLTRRTRENGQTISNSVVSVLLM